MQESAIERYLRGRFNVMGAMFCKQTSPGNAGWPDRILITKDGYIAFVELKQEGKKPRPLQKAVLERLRQHNAHVYVISGMTEAREFANEMAKRCVKGNGDI